MSRAEMAQTPLLAVLLVALLLAPSFSVRTDAAPAYPWLDGKPATRTLEAAIAPPPGFTRVPVEPGSFAAWLRGLPMKADGVPVRYYDGRLKWHQSYHAAVLDIDTGTRDLQQCADAIMRLRAEYLLASGRSREIAFNYTDGRRVAFRGRSYADFKRYLIGVFSYAGSYSLEREMIPVPLADMRIGDVFIQGGFPGHAVLVIDMAENRSTGEKRFLLMQSFMPAQDMHILKNPKSRDGTAWYSTDIGKELVTPEWIFEAKHLRRFRS
jgi:hypothetical protein